MDRFDIKTAATRIGQCSLVQYPAGVIVFSQGDAADSVLFIEDGKILTSVLSEDGRGAVISILGGGDILGESCLLGAHVRLSSAKALVPTVAVSLTKDAVVNCFATIRRLRNT